MVKRNGNTCIILHERYTNRKRIESSEYYVHENNSLNFFKGFAWKNEVNITPSKRNIGYLPFFPQTPVPI